VPSLIEEKIKLSRYVLNAMVYGVNRPFNVALLCANMPEIKAWAKLHHVRAHDDEALLAHGAIRHLVQKDVDTLTEEFKQYERIGGFALIAEDFSVLNGLLTPKLSLKRRSVLEQYRAQFEALYPPRRSAFPPSD
jgi:long-chain acyl-CoA synthetase